MVGDRRPTQLYCGVGKVTSRWEFIELAMAELFGVLVADGSITSLRVYGALSGVSARKDVIRAAMETYFQHDAKSDLEKQVRSVLLAYDRASWQRNDIAHGIVTQFVNGGTKEVSGFLLVPPSYSTKKFGRFPTHGRANWLENALGQFSYALLHEM